MIERFVYGSQIYNYIANDKLQRYCNLKFKSGIAATVNHDQLKNTVQW